MSADIVEEENNDDDEEEGEGEGVKVNNDKGSCGNDRCNVAALGSLSDVKDMAELVFLF